MWLIKIDSEGTLLWQKCYGGLGSDGAMRIFENNDNSNYIIGGSFSSDGDISNDPYPNSGDYWIIKIDSIGNIIWDRIVGGPGDEQIWTGTKTSDGGIIAFGNTKAGGGDVANFYGYDDMWMVKLSSVGTKEWDFTIGTSWIDVGKAIIETNDGGYLSGGSSQIEAGGNISCEPFNYEVQAVLMKLDSNRNIEWQQCYGGSSDDDIDGILELSDGYIFIGNGSSSDGDLVGSGWHGGGDIWIVKIDFSGNIVWQKCFGGSLGEYSSNIYQTKDGGFVVIGNTQSHDGDVVGNHSINNRYDIWMFKINREGELLWQKCIGGISDETVDFGVLKLSDYKYVIAGTATYSLSFDVNCDFHSAGSGTGDYWVFQISDTTISIKESQPKLNELKVYPNPARDFVVFERQGAEAKQQKLTYIQIATVFGQVRETIELRGDKTVWLTEGVKPGVYFYKIEGGGYLGKVVVAD